MSQLTVSSPLVEPADAARTGSFTVEAGYTSNEGKRCSQRVQGTYKAWHHFSHYRSSENALGNQSTSASASSTQHEHPSAVSQQNSLPFVLPTLWKSHLHARYEGESCFSTLEKYEVSPTLTFKKHRQCFWQIHASNCTLPTLPPSREYYMWTRTSITLFLTRLRFQRSNRRRGLFDKKLSMQDTRCCMSGLVGGGIAAATRRFGPNQLLFPLSGNVVGYHITQPCSRCLESCNNGHFWMFRQLAVLAHDRFDSTGLQPLLWANLPGADRDLDMSVFGAYRSYHMLCRWTSAVFLILMPCLALC